jgi:Tfp pilus assembly protein PilF
MYLRRSTVFLFFLALSVLPGRAQTQPNGRNVFSIDGYVRDDSGQHSVENIRVDLLRSGGTPLNTAYTRGNGEFVFDGLPSGDFVIEINVKDYEPVRQPVTILNSSVRGLSIFLAKHASAVNPLSGWTISAHQLSVPHKAYDEFEKGMALLYGKSEDQAAIDQFQRAIKDFPTYYEAYAEEGGAYYHLGEMAPAEEALRKSIDLSSGQYADAYFTLASLLNDANRFTEAADVARKAIAADSSSWRGTFELARAFTALKQPEEAEKNAEKSRDLMPDNPPVYLLLANIHIQRRDYPSLLRDLDDYLRLAPAGPDADRARKTREEVKAILNPPGGESTATGQEKPQSGSKESHPAPEPDTSGLPSLPPPTPGNQ